MPFPNSLSLSLCVLLFNDGASSERTWKGEAYCSEYCINLVIQNVNIGYFINDKKKGKTIPVTGRGGP
jgi:hypothetical protein